MTRKKAGPRLGVLVAAWLLSQGAMAGTAYDEGSQGDLSSVGSAPTLVSLALGDNSVEGTTGALLGGVDRDYFSITVAAGQRLTGLTVQSGTETVGAFAFIAVQAGPVVTVGPTAGDPTGLLGWAHYGGADIGQDILPRMGTGFGADGFSGALGPGEYAFWVQDTGPGVSSYSLGLTLQAVPEPASAALLAAGLLAGAAWRRRR